MLDDILIYVSHDGKSSRRCLQKNEQSVTPEEFRLAVMENPPAVEALSPPVARLQLAVLRSVHDAAGFAYDLSRMKMGDNFRRRFFSLLDAASAALAEVHKFEAGLAAARASCGFPPTPSLGGRQSSSATYALAVLARDIHREACQAALDVHTKSRKKAPNKTPDGRVEVDPPPAAFDKEIARRFNREFNFPEASTPLVEMRLELMRLDILEAAATGPAAPPDLPVITSLGAMNYCVGDGPAVCATPAEDAALQSFIGTQAINECDLIKISGYSTAPRALNSLRSKHKGYFSSAISCPGKRGAGGYRANVVKA